MDTDFHCEWSWCVSTISNNCIVLLNVIIKSLIQSSCKWVRKLSNNFAVQYVILLGTKLWTVSLLYVSTYNSGFRDNVDFLGFQLHVVKSDQKKKLHVVKQRVTLICDVDQNLDFTKRAQSNSLSGTVLFSDYYPWALL